METANRKFINIMFDIFGYSFVGILAFLFGLVLQNYNSNGEFFKMILNYAGDVRSVILVIFVQLLLILLFGHAYAKSILLGKEDLEAQDGIDVCAIVGHWLETIIVIIAVMLVMIQIIWPTFLNRYFWCTILLNSASYVLSFIAYRRLLVKKYYSEEEQNKLMALRASSCYVLFCPAAVMIGFNILSGANICAMLDGSYLCYLCSIVVWLGLFLVYFADNRSRKNVCAWYLLIVIIGSGVISISDFGSLNDRVVLKNFFLAGMVSVFLSIFESWYVVFRQKENSPNALYFRLTLGVVATTPAVVAILFPIQNFNLVYFLSFWVGMSITDYISFVVVFPIVNSSNKKGGNGKYINTKRNVAFARAGCGIATLILLMLDKYFVFMLNWSDSGAYLVSDDALSTIALGMSIFGLILPMVNHKIRNDGTDYWVDTNKKWKMEAYMTLRIILIVIAILISPYLYGFANGDYEKAILSSGAIIVHLIISLLIYWKKISVDADVEGG